MPFNLSPHEAFNPPPERATLWRYMDIPKYLQMLSSHSIWFSRADLLGDPFEGSTTQITKDAVGALYNSFIPTDFADRSMDLFSKSLLMSKLRTYVNSWHCSEIESAAMWNLYRKEYGISIISSVERMKESFTWEDEIFPSRINYVDYETTFMPQGNVFWPFVHKRQSFEHEKEVRLISLSIEASRALPHDVNAKTFAEMAERTPVGYQVPTDLMKLIAEVRIDPSAPVWLASTIVEVTKRMGFDFEVSQSVLGQDPIF